MASLVVSALSTWSNKGLKKAEKDVSKFDKTVKDLSKTFAGVFAASKIIGYSKNAVKAFVADEQAAKALEVQLGNLGLAFAAPGVENYIAKLQKTYGVLDDQLRPAFQTLITASGNLTASQKALAVALDVSAGTGKSVEEVSAALAKGFAGQTTGISRLNAGIDKNILATGDMNKIMDALNKKWSGQASARLGTYAGKMDLLNVYAANASETIGKGLIDALEILGKDKSIEGIGTSMENLATNIANVTTNLAKMIKGFGNVVSNPAFQAVLALLLLRSGKVDILAKLFAGGLVAGILTAPKQPISMEENRALAQKRIADRMKEAAAIKNGVTYRTQENALLKAKTETDKLKDKFDLERIGLMTALNSATDEETKLRLKAQLALLDENQVLAKRYNAELEAAKSLKELTDAFTAGALTTKSTFADIKAYMDRENALRAAGVNVVTPPAVQEIITQGIIKEADRITTEAVPTYLEKLRTTVKSGYTVPSVEDFYGSLNAGSYMPTNSSGSSGGTPEVTVNLNAAGSIIGLQEVDAAIQDALLRIYRQNGDLAPAGFIP
jgi:hypothetical protein